MAMDKVMLYLLMMQGFADYHASLHKRKKELGKQVAAGDRGAWRKAGT